MPSETHVTGTGLRVTVDCDGRAYTLRPITFGEAAELAQAEAGDINAGPAMLNDALRQAVATMLPDADRAAALEVIDAHEDAEIRHHAIAAALPHPQEPPDALATWRKERQQAHEAMLRALVRKAVVERRLADNAEVRKVRAALESGAWTRRSKLLQISLDMDAAAVNALPAGDADLLFSRAEAMRRPGAVEGKA